MGNGKIASVIGLQKVVANVRFFFIKNFYFKLEEKISNNLKICKIFTIIKTKQIYKYLTFNFLYGMP